MSDTVTCMAVFEEISPAANAIARLQEMGLKDEEVNVISGIPVSNRILGRPRPWTHVPIFALVGAALGIIAAAFFMWGIPLLFPLHVGGQPLYPFPPWLVVGFELTMLGMMTAAFLGVFIDSRFPSDEPKEYATDVSDGKIAIVFTCRSEKASDFETAMLVAGAEWARPVEAKRL
jgi:hypothetical protein